jgi:hypothetical protein
MMRFLSVIPVAAILALAPSACSSDDGEVSVDDLTQDELAAAAFAAFGAKTAQKNNTEGLCNGCHDTANRTTYNKWNEQYVQTMKTLKDKTKTKDERIRSMLRDPARPESGFDSAKIGILTAGAHLGIGPNIKKDKHKRTYEQNSVLADLFQESPELYQQFLGDTLMPVEPRFDRFSPGQYEAVLAWMQKGMPKLKESIPDEGRPTKCVEDLSGLKSEPSRIRAKSWYTANKEARMPMFACDAAGQEDPTVCFQQKIAGKDVFASSRDVEYGKGWAAGTSTLRIAKNLGSQNTFFWSRTSADGRFFATGGSGKKSFFVDLEAELKGKTRIIPAAANYDPDFFPGNKAFMFQGTAKGGVVCAQSLLTNPATASITFDEPECSKLDEIKLYQTVAQAKGDNEFSDIFVVNNSFASDNPSLTASTQDLQLTAGPESAARIAVGVSTGTEGGYKVSQVTEVPMPFFGDTMASRSLELLGSRVAGDGKMLGYQITRLLPIQNATGYKFAAQQLGRICMPGNKANFSFDERFLVTHHYLAREDFPTDAAFEAYKATGAADIYMVDFVTGKKTRITNMQPGQFALFPHFRSDGWIYFEVRDSVRKETYIVVSDAAVSAVKEVPTP